MSSLSQIERIKSIAYQGSTGKLREQFCLDYLEHKKKLIRLIEESLLSEVELNGEIISCSKGCAVCCASYIVASLQECEAIVYWLYHHPEALSVFLRNFPGWQERTGKIRLVLEAIAGSTGKGEPDKLKSAMSQYRRQEIPCPFLHENACAIYEARPWACAGVVSVSPKEWCYTSSPNWDKLKTYRYETYAMFENPFYLKLEKAIPLGCLPEMVHGLLAGGFDFLAGYSGWKNPGVMDKSKVRDAERHKIVG